MTTNLKTFVLAIAMITVVAAASTPAEAGWSCRWVHMWQEWVCD